MRPLLATVLVLVLTAAGCGSPRPVSGARTAPVRGMSDVPLGEAFEIARGTSVLVDGHRLRFDAVREDSRCPEGTTCVWAGQAVAAFSFVATQALRPVLLQLPGTADVDAEPLPEQTTAYAGYRFTILALDPYPGTADAGETPVATVRVESAGG